MMTSTIRIPHSPIAMRHVRDLVARCGILAPRRVRVVAVLCALINACDEDILCPEGLAPAVALEVIDDDTGRPAWYGALALISDGPYLDTLTAPVAEARDSTIRVDLVGGIGRAGVYSVRVLKGGYMTWERTGVTVARTSSPCSRVLTVRLQARLERP